jgi:hypothetical protein
MSNDLRASSKYWLLLPALLLFVPARLISQDSVFASTMKTTLIQPVPPSPFIERTAPVTREHRFLDRDNRILFTAVAATGAADFCATRSNLARGGRELNPITNAFAGNTPALAASFAGQTAGTIGISYLFHKAGHHKLERITSLLNISGSATAFAYSLAHR